MKYGILSILFLSIIANGYFLMSVHNGGLVKKDEFLFCQKQLQERVFNERRAHTNGMIGGKMDIPAPLPMMAP